MSTTTPRASPQPWALTPGALLGSMRKGRSICHDERPFVRDGAQSPPVGPWRRLKNEQRAPRSCPGNAPRSQRRPPLAELLPAAISFAPLRRAPSEPEQDLVQKQAWRCEHLPLQGEKKRGDRPAPPLPRRRSCRDWGGARSGPNGNQVPWMRQARHLGHSDVRRCEAPRRSPARPRKRGGPTDEARAQCTSQPGHRPRSRHQSRPMEGHNSTPHSLNLPSTRRRESPRKPARRLAGWCRPRPCSSPFGSVFSGTFEPRLG